MEYGSLSKNEKELKKVILIMDAKELSLLTVACEEYYAAHPRQKNIKKIIKELEDIAVYWKEIK